MATRKYMNSNSNKYRKLSLLDKTVDNGENDFEEFSEEIMNEPIQRGKTNLTTRAIRQEKHKR